MTTRVDAHDTYLATQEKRVATRHVVPIGWPRMSILLGAIALAISNFLPIWQLRLNAPQYPGGLFVTLFTHDVTGDVWEVDGLNHYIGMMPLGEAATLERSLAVPAVIGMLLMGLLAVVLRKKVFAWLALPIVMFPFVFAADLYYWLYKAGNELDPTAAITIDPFTPAIVGRGVVGQFSTDGMFQMGFWIALVGAVLAAVGIIGRLRHEPVVES